MAPGRATHGLGVALLGFGYAGRVFHAPLIEATPGLSLRVVASRRAGAVAAACPGVRVVTDPLQAIRQTDVDLVVVATPNETHAPLAEAALRAGRHVVVDKPFTVTLDEARALVALARKVGTVLSVFQNRRWDSDFLVVAQVLRAGDLGEVVECRSEISRWRPTVRDRWREQPGPGAGLWYDLGPHLIDQVLRLFGLPHAVHAMLRTQRPGGRTIDWFQVTLEYPGRQAVLVSSMLAAAPAPRFVLRGTDGAAVKAHADPQEHQRAAGVVIGSDTWGHDPDPLVVWSPDGTRREVAAPAGDWGRYYAMLRDAIQIAAPPPVTLPEALRVMAVLEAGLQSSSTARAVRPAPVDAE